MMGEVRGSCSLRRRVQSRRLARLPPPLHVRRARDADLRRRLARDRRPLLPRRGAFCVGPLAIGQPPVLAVISLYLVLGIGVDAIFIFCNSYALAEREARDVHAAAGGGGGSGDDDGPPTERRRWCGRCGPMADRPTRSHEERVLASALRHAVGVTALSTSTTAVAFGASIASPITTIRQFSIFQTSVVVADFVLILCLWLPLLVGCRRRLFAVHATHTPPPRRWSCRWVARVGVRLLLLPVWVLRLRRARRFGGWRGRASRSFGTSSC